MSHYEWLEKNLPVVFERLNMDYSPGIIVAHGDKCYQYKDAWNQAGIHFFHGVALYLLTYLRPYIEQVIETKNGWVDPYKWVIDNYPKFIRDNILPDNAPANKY